MWLKLDLDGIKLYFNIKGYKKSTDSDWCDEWCNVEISVRSENWLNYSQSGTLLLACEVEELLSQFEDLMEDRVSEPKELEFVEPDLKVTLNPKKDLRQDPRVTYIKQGYEIVDVDAEFKVYFWNGCLTENYLSLCMDREDLFAFITYLKLVTKQIDKKDAAVQALLKDGILLEY